MRHYREHCVLASDAERLAELRLDCAAIVGRELGGEAATLEASALLPTLLASLRFTPYPDARGGARALACRRRPPGGRQQLGRLAARRAPRDAAWPSCLDAVATSAEVGASKPSGELFAAALALAGVDAWQAVHVGDSWGEDVEGARAAGIDAVWLRRRPHDGAAPPAAGVRVIETLEDF